MLTKSPRHHDHDHHWPRRKYITVLAVAAIPVFVHIVRSRLPTRVHYSPTPSSLAVRVRSSQSSLFFDAEEITQRSYSETFGALSEETSCSSNISVRACIEGLLSEAMMLSLLPSQPQTNVTTLRGKSFPWWFITMLRDIIGKSGVDGGW